MNTEISYCQSKAALYMTRLLKANIFKADIPPFYEYLHFSGVSIKELLCEVTASVREKPDSSAYSEAIDELHQARCWPIGRTETYSPPHWA